MPPLPESTTTNRDEPAGKLGRRCAGLAYGCNVPKTQAEGQVDKLVHDRFFPGATDGVFVDVGAAGPEFLSMSAYYRGLGWRVIAIEPNPVFCQAHRAAGHEILQYACSDRDEDGVDFEIVDSHGTAYSGGSVSFESF
jgi:hypothetical protein